MREVVPTRSAALALADERRLMRQGFEFLDEKRMLLAGEMLRQSRRWEDRRARFAEARRTAAAALAAAVEAHGLDALQMLAPPPVAPAPPPTRAARFLGVPLREIEPAEATPDDEVRPAVSAEIAATRAAHARLIALAAELGATTGNLERLIREYRRVERRAEALENVLLPEVDAALARVIEQLDLVDQEEAVRVQSLGRRRARDA